MNLRPTSLLIACATAFIAWRCVATVHDRIAHAAEEPFAARAAWLTADRDARIDSTFGIDAPMVRAIEAHMPRGDTLMLYGAAHGNVTVIRDRLVLLQIRLYFLLFPNVVTMGIGPIERPEAYAVLLTPEKWIMNLTPDVDRPLADRFEVVVRGEGFEFSRAVSSRP